MTTPESPIPVPSIGSATPPTFLERWGVLFLACAGGWVILVGTATIIFYFLKAPTFPDITHLSSDHAQQALNLHNQLQDQWRESLTALFDLLVTRTVLPIVTLLLGYLFGKKE